MHTQVSVKAALTGAQTYYADYASARSAANAGDVITLWADLDEQIILKDGVDILIISGRVLDMTDALPTITDNGVKCICNIFGEGIIKNSYNSAANHECLKLTHSQSEVYIECDYMEAPGGTSSLSGIASTILVANANKFSLICNNLYNHTDSVIVINNCEDFYIKCKTIESGVLSDTNEGNSVIYSSGSGYIFADEITCDGFGSCVEQAGGKLYGKILKLTKKDNATDAKPTVLLDNVSGEQNLILYFDEIQNLNMTEGDAVTLAEGKAVLTGRRIYSESGLSLDLAANSHIRCNEIISAEQSINISNTYPEKISIIADTIEGNSDETGVIYVEGAANLSLKGAKIKNLDTSSDSFGIYIEPAEETPILELINMIVVSGNETSGVPIFCNQESGETTLFNYTLFVNEEIVGFQEILVGTTANYKYIVSQDVS